MSLSNKNILVGVSGSIAAYKVCEAVSSLKKQGAEVKVIATDSALQFVGKATFEGLTGHAVLTGDFTDGSMMSHIQLAKWADIFVIAPATAQTVNALAQGTGSGILTSTYLAYDLTKPLLVAPAMNTKMLEHPTTQASLEKLANMGLRILSPESGDLACGDVGPGRLVEPAQIVEAIREELSPRRKLSILITAGGTTVPIDSVRSITNTSTGRTGAILADYFHDHRYQVDMLMSENGATPVRCRSVERYKTYDDLARAMEARLTKKTYDLVIHAAAVSDFTVATKNAGKIRSGARYTLELEPTKKLLGQIKTWSPQSRVVAFKLTDTPDAAERAEAVGRLFAQSADWVVHNDLSEIQAGKHVFTLLGREEAPTKLQSAMKLAAAIEAKLKPASNVQKTINSPHKEIHS